MSQSPFEILTRLPDDYDWGHHKTDAPRRRLEAAEPPRGLSDHEAGSAAYRPDKDLTTAVNAAIHLRAPLLVTGDPGTGKTQLAFFLMRYFGVDLYPYTVRSASTARNLRYDYDAVAYLREVYLARAVDKTESAPSDGAPDTVADTDADPDPDADADIDIETDPDRDPRMKHITKGPLWQAFTLGRPCVVLIDEIDKAPRDFPNDLLQELDKQEFPHPFSRSPKHAVRAARDQLPIVVVTSNNERRLPDAFLRRCIVHHIEMTRDLMNRAVAAHGIDYPGLGPEVHAAAIDRFEELRRVERLSRKPGIAELLAWLVTLARAKPRIRADDLKGIRLSQLPHLHCLIKDHDDSGILDEARRR